MFALLLFISQCAFNSQDAYIFKGSTHRRVTKSLITSVLTNIFKRSNFDLVTLILTGFRGNPSSWPKNLQKILSSAVLATENFFQMVGIKCTGVYTLYSLGTVQNNTFVHQIY